MAKNYIDNLSEEVKKRMQEKAAQGGFPGKVPVGYINNKETHTVELDVEKAGFIQKLFEWYASGVKTRDWLAFLDDFRTACLTAEYQITVNLINAHQLLNPSMQPGY